MGTSPLLARVGASQIVAPTSCKTPTPMAEGISWRGEEGWRKRCAPQLQCRPGGFAAASRPSQLPAEASGMLASMMTAPTAGGKPKFPTQPYLWHVQAHSQESGIQIESLGTLYLGTLPRSIAKPAWLSGHVTGRSSAKGAAGEGDLGSPPSPLSLPPTLLFPRYL